MLSFAFPNNPLSLFAEQNLVFQYIGTLSALVLGLGGQVYQYRAVLNPADRMQVKGTLFGFVFASLAYTVFIILFAQDHPIAPFLAHTAFVTTMIIFTGSITVALLRYRLWDIDTLISKTLLYAILTALLALTLFASVWALQGLFRAMTGSTSDAAIVIATLVSMVIVQPARQRIQHVIDRTFYRQKVTQRQAILTLSREIQTLVDLPVLLTKLVKVMVDLLYLSYAAIYLPDENETMQLASGYLQPDSAASHLDLDRIELTQLKHSRAVTKPHSVFPLFLPLIVSEATHNRLVGVLALGPRRSGTGYSHDDIVFLQTVVAPLGTSLYTAMLAGEEQRQLEEANRVLRESEAQLEHKVLERTRELHLAKEEAEAARERAEQANQIKSQFLASMSHELRTPLNAILNFTEMVSVGMLGPVNERQKEALNDSLNSSVHLLDLINDVLDMTKLQSGMLSLFIENDVNLHAELAAVISTAETLIQKKPVKLATDIDAELPLVHGDKRRIRQILLNLISNAAKFTEQGVITLSAKANGDEVCFVVADTGPGIATEDQARIFEPFVQTETGIKHAGGTGLGLPISRWLAEAHGGRLTVKSALGKGSVFTFVLPVTAHVVATVPGE